MSPTCPLWYIFCLFIVNNTIQLYLLTFNFWMRTVYKNQFYNLSFNRNICQTLYYYFAFEDRYLLIAKIGIYKLATWLYRGQNSFYFIINIVRRASIFIHRLSHILRFIFKSLLAFPSIRPNSPFSYLLTYRQILIIF